MEIWLPKHTSLHRFGLTILLVFSILTLTLIPVSASASIAKNSIEFENHLPQVTSDSHRPDFGNDRAIFTGCSHERVHTSLSCPWNTFLGGGGTDYGWGIAVDSGGNVYVAGHSNASWKGSQDPVRAYASGQDAFAAKFDDHGSLLWNTFLGGSGSDYCYGVAVDGGGNVYVGGYSNAAWKGGSDPVRAYTSGQDAFAAKLDGNGNLIWNTFLGGSGADLGYGIAVDGSGNIYLGGYSYANWKGNSDPVRAYSSGADAFAAKLDSDGSLQWNTFLGGSGKDDNPYGRNDNSPFGIAADRSGNVYVSGYSYATWNGNSEPVRAYTSGTDAFAAKLDSSGALQWNTFLGGNGYDYGYGIAMDGSGNVYVGGYSDATWKGNSDPVRAYASGHDAFAVKLNNDGSLIWNTFLGGTGEDYAWGGIAVDVSGNVYMGGHGNATWKAGLDSLRAFTSGQDAFAVKLENNGILLWNTFLGGVGDDYGRGVAVDASGNMYISGSSNDAWKVDSEPVRAYTSGTDAFTAKLEPGGRLTDVNKHNGTRVMPGDANGDGRINILDMAKVAGIILGQETDDFPGADSNLDGVVNFEDITKIARIILGLDNNKLY